MKNSNPTSAFYSIPRSGSNVMLLINSSFPDSKRLFLSFKVLGSVVKFTNITHQLILKFSQKFSK